MEPKREPNTNKKEKEPIEISFSICIHHCCNTWNMIMNHKGSQNQSIYIYICIYGRLVHACMHIYFFFNLKIHVWISPSIIPQKCQYHIKLGTGSSSIDLSFRKIVFFLTLKWWPSQFWLSGMSQTCSQNFEASPDPASWPTRNCSSRCAA